MYLTHEVGVAYALLACLLHLGRVGQQEPVLDRVYLAREILVTDGLAQPWVSCQQQFSKLYIFIVIIIIFYYHYFINIFLLLFFININ